MTRTAEAVDGGWWSCRRTGTSCTRRGFDFTIRSPASRSSFARHFRRICIAAIAAVGESDELSADSDPLTTFGFYTIPD